MGPRPAAKLTGHGLWNSDIATKVPFCRRPAMTRDNEKAPALIAPRLKIPTKRCFEAFRGRQAFRLSGTLPPFSASLVITCLCSQIFMEAESFMSPL